MLRFSQRYIETMYSLERHHLDGSISIFIIQKHINDMISEIKTYNDLLSLNEIIKVLKIDNNCLQKLPKSLLVKLLDNDKEQVF